MVTNQQTQAIGVFSDPHIVEKALQELQNTNFPMQQVSVIARNANKDAQVDGAEVSDRIGDTKVETTTSVVANTASTSAAGSVLLGLTSLAIPGLGPILAAGTFATALVATVAASGAGAIAAGQLVKALSDLGIPEEQARIYSEHLHQGNYLIILDGTDDEIEQAANILEQQKIEDWSVYQPKQ